MGVATPNKFIFVAVPLLGILTAIAAPPATIPTTAGQANVAYSAPTEAEIVSGRWWLDLAESELKNVGASPERHTAISPLIRARISCSDLEGANRLLLEIPKDSRELSSLQDAVARERIRQFIAAGQLDNANDVALKTGPPRPFNRGCWADLAVAEARAGDTASAFKILATLDKDTAGKAAIAAVSELIADGNLKRAHSVADQIGNDFWKQSGIEHVAIAEAATGDTQGAIRDVALLTAPSVRSSACVDVAAAAATKKDDLGAARIIESLPTEARPMAVRYFALAQLDRGDPSVAIETADKIDGSDREIFWQTFAEDSVRLGYTDDAIKALQGKWEPVAVATTFNAMLKYQKLDAARSLLGMLPERSSSNGFDYIDFKISAKRRLARALANNDQLIEANRLLTETEGDAATHPPRRPDPSKEEAKLAIAAAELRAGNMERYDRERKPYIDAVRAPAGGASQRDARIELVGFDFATHNISGLEIDLQNAEGEEMAEITYEIAFSLMDPAQNADRPRYLAEDRRLLALVLRNPKIGRRELLITVAGWHAQQSKLGDWLSWSRALQNPGERLSAYIAAATALKPPAIVDY